MPCSAGYKPCSLPGPASAPSADSTSTTDHEHRPDEALLDAVAEYPSKDLGSRAPADDPRPAGNRLEPLGALAAQLPAPVLDAQVRDLLSQREAVLDVLLGHACCSFAGDETPQGVLELRPAGGLVVPDPAAQPSQQVGLGLGEFAGAVQAPLRPSGPTKTAGPLITQSDQRPRSRSWPQL